MTKRAPPPSCHPPTKQWKVVERENNLVIDKEKKLQFLQTT